MNALQRYDDQRLVRCKLLVGVDEAGRGCLAGPVMAAACVVSKDLLNDAKALQQSAQINDSKQLTPAAREGQFAVLQALQAQGQLDFSVAAGSVEEIAEHNILGATRLAMRRALEELARRKAPFGSWTLPHPAAAEPLFQADPRVKLLVDGRPLKPFPYAHEGIVKGDGTSLCIAMASIAAKVSRDRVMQRLAKTYPAYGFDRHKGYGTAVHRAALLTHGATPIHRERFLRKLRG